jgi:uncharacterized membrane protein YfhO
MQQYYPGWEVFVDGAQSKIIISNYLFMSLVLENGNHTVDFIYKNRNVQRAFYISATVFLFCLISLFYFERKKLAGK